LSYQFRSSPTNDAGLRQVPNSHFKFTYADIFNLGYNSKGKIRPENFTFPCAGESIDFAFATSVFSHMRSAEVRRYLAEIRRTLKPQGTAMLTFYILDETAVGLMQNGKAEMKFAIDLDDCFTIDAKTPEREIGPAGRVCLSFKMSSL
jgi:SAM-dependent methyltransferase